MLTKIWIGKSLRQPEALRNLVLDFDLIFASLWRDHPVRIQSSKGSDPAPTNSYSIKARLLVPDHQLQVSEGWKPKALTICWLWLPVPRCIHFLFRNGEAEFWRSFPSTGRLATAMIWMPFEIISSLHYWGKGIRFTLYKSQIHQCVDIPC